MISQTSITLPKNNCKAKRCLVSTAWTSTRWNFTLVAPYPSAGEHTHLQILITKLSLLYTNHEHLHVSPWQPSNHKMKLTVCTQRGACSSRGALMWGGKALRVHWLVPPAYTCVEWVCASYSSQTGHSPSFLISYHPKWRVRLTNLWHVHILTNSIASSSLKFWGCGTLVLVVWATIT